VPAPRRRFWVSPGLVSLIQYLLMLAGIALLLGLLLRRPSPGMFAAALLLAACLAALPSLIFSGVLPWRLSRRLERLRCNGVVASAQVISLPDPLPASAVRRGAANSPPPQAYLEIPVRLHSPGEPTRSQCTMLMPIGQVSSLSPGVQVEVFLDPAHPDLVLFNSDKK
jgi:hypothetical protein